MARDGDDDATYWIDRLGLMPHPEGGHFRETYRARETIAAEALPARFTGARAFSTAVYYLLRAGERSFLHRLRADELWHHYAGDPLAVTTIDDDGTLTVHALGHHVERGERFQVLVPAGTWFGAMLPEPATGKRAGARGFALVGCTVAPGFDFADFEMASRADLLHRHPQHRDVIERLTR